MSILYIVGTPIGNLEDITLRALRVLREAYVILCEDTRVTKRLLEKYEIKDKQLLAYNEQKSGASAEYVIKLLQDGKNIALVTDAGTPGISDPCSMLVQKVREVLLDVKIESIPGPSALTAALSVAGVSADSFLFLGFLPHKKGRETLFKEIAEEKRTVVFYESPHRILKALESLLKHAPKKQITICRELTKIHEEVVRGTVLEVLEYFRNNPEKVRGEFVVIVSV
ncbi:MAG: 16S rRNA (cytidine(1402)-2'-O)-methyltransferase [Candidatus Taylorbacteria bacterium RIFCSPHIGHO2_02_FULL_47_18]|nr:MAG: 16S rRNA (cytidine(1402)-2'-O)-methyltransferase [Candidatus Taylorbacteria bacterium RIFCSPHIGHO2_01_FULL_48_38]OHA28548.1 MAG: 16S rRNA (cytidine(1402)-2'-O)-methyltransferase [Candidatus Taylorbacteria bacterium RIFCSPHIGHO2_02_FULL_47_18]OHA40777.1 MAG: 16S rRNA (cytidine(1402)-2'-O)-methyltransferase [Candidatus Taylorbacteria bacterium RIFCSPLOWO2_02_FULL_48_16]OHA45362.1 MAG: 16S rRNA (cytidine(1402)-2'-O)-methyltransferase [Candidatus Taylorbacteria bacterium RIFCSPLOWO2_12_FULL_